MKQYKYESRDYYERHIKYHQSAWTAYDEATRPKWGGSAYMKIGDNWRLIRKGTTLMIARGELDIGRLIGPHNHKLLPDGAVSTLCIDGHYGITRSESNSWYDVLYI